MWYDNFYKNSKCVFILFECCVCLYVNKMAEIGLTYLIYGVWKD